MRRFGGCLAVGLVLVSASFADENGPRSAPKSYPRANYAWPFALGPDYGAVSETERPVRTVVGTFDLSRLDREIPAGLSAAPVAPGDATQRYFIAQLAITSERRTAIERVVSLIESAAGQVIAALPVDAWIVRVDAAGLAALEASGEFSAIVPYHPAFKLHPRIGQVPMLDPAQALSTTYRLDVILWPGEAADPVAFAVQRLGGRTFSVRRDQLVVELSPSGMFELAKHDAVRLIIEDLPIRLLGGRPPAYTQTGVIDTGERPFTAAGIDGSGIGGPGVCTISAGPCTEASDCNGTEDVCSIAPQVLLVIDTGIQLDAADLSDTGTSAGTAGPAHRKVRRYERSFLFGGEGDFLGCDDPLRGGTHGHFVAAHALGNATGVDPGYGPGFTATDSSGNLWDLDGVAPGALLVFFDAQVTPLVGPCADPSKDAINPGDLYDGVGGGAFEDAYLSDGARVATVAWGSPGGQYTTEAIDADNFLVSHPDAMILAAAGQYESYPSTGIQAPATAKNVLAIGGQEVRSDDGPAPGNRIAPQLLAYRDPLTSFTCATGDDDQNDPVECIPVIHTGSSTATAVASGAALLVRDYFAQGFYPDGTRANPGNAADRVSNISGALVKALLINSAEYSGFSLTYRHNNDYGYGAIALAHTLPLPNWSGGPTGLVVTDGGILGGVNDLVGLSDSIDATVAGAEAATFSVCDTSQELRVTLAWTDEVDGGLTGALVNDLDLELLSPTGVLYRGNYFTDDDDRNEVIDASTEDCPGVDGQTGNLDAAAWSLPACTRTDLTDSPVDATNPMEAIMLSPDYDGDGAADPDPTNDNQIETGTWTLTVRSAGTGLETAQRYAVAVSGGLCGGSAVDLDKTTYVCNDTADITVIEFAQVGDSMLDATIVAARLRVEVHDADGLVDCEGLGCAGQPSALSLTQSDPATDTYRYDDLPLTAGTARDPGNGVLDVRHGDLIRVVYADESGGVPDPDLERHIEAGVDCRLDVEFQTIVFAQWGTDATTQTIGGCERSARGLFEYGFPDRYLDAGESVILRFGFGSRENTTLENVRASLRCVEIDDVNAPANCLPGSNDCADPDRTGNAPCPAAYLTIVNPVIDLGVLPPDSGTSANFDIVMGTDAAIPDGHEVEFVVELTATTGGLSAPAVVVSRQTLDVDEFSLFYSTDFPTGGVQIVDLNNNELVEDPTTDPINLLRDYRFETRLWSDLTAGGTKNTGLQSPWNFDVNDGGFRVGIGHDTTVQGLATLPAQWGEDLNFNNLLDGYCSIGHCDVNTAAGCTVDAHCVAGGNGTECVYEPQGFCEIASSTQCETNLDCPPGDLCDLIECVSSIPCAELSGLVRCISPLEDREPRNFGLDQTGWSTGGGCGWQSRAPGTCSTIPGPCSSDDDCPFIETCDLGTPWATGGIWHTGAISPRTPGACTLPAPDECELFDTIPGTNGELEWHELLLTPEIERVQGPGYQVEILNWAWNQAIETPDFDVQLSWDFDLDTATNDLYDGDVLSRFFRSDSPLTSPYASHPFSGFPMFAPIGPSFVSVNGSLGNNRVGQNACYFEGGVLNGSAYSDFLLAGPPDDDLANGTCPGTPWVACSAYCNGGSNDGQGCNDVAGDGDCPGGDCRADDPDPAYNDCNVSESCVAGACSISGASCGVDADCYTCAFLNATIDEYVTENGPIRNMDITQGFGPDMRFYTLADIAGPAGERFQGALGIHNFESDGNNPAVEGYGWGIDDMVIEWREFTLVPDTTDCLSGSCAAIDVVATNIYASEGELRISVLDPSPSVNDCNDDGDTTDAGIDDTDCDDDGMQDVRVKAWTAAEVSGEFATLNATVPGVFEGSLPYSVVDVAGVLGIANEFDAFATSLPVYIEYIDRDDGTAQPCGTVQTTARIFFDSVGVVRLAGVSLRDNGDDDGWADSHETIEMTVSIFNPSDTDLTGVRVVASTDDPNVDCMLDSTAALGDLDAGATRPTATPIRFRVSGVDRSALGLGSHDTLQAVIDLRVTADQFLVNEFALHATLELDLDAVGSSVPTTFFEGFESGTVGAFGDAQNIDQDLDDLVAADGYRCQYADPDWPPNATFEDSDCFPGVNPAHADQFWWDIAGPGSIDGGRAFSGSRSLYYGTEIDADLLFTTPTGILEAIATDPPINLGWERICDQSRAILCTTDADCPAGESCVSPSPVFSFKHQVSLLDWRTAGASGPTRSGDGSVIQVQQADDVGSPVGDWIKVEPYLNPYDAQREDNYNVCSFDPIDDGNTEDDFFDPTNPFRRFGPSSTCFPDFVFAYVGDTDTAFDPLNIGRAAHGPGLAGSVGVGTWVESRVDLSEFRGKRIRLRFLVSALKLAETWYAAFNYAQTIPGDDGWWIDDVRVTDASTVPATLVPDTKDNSALPGCGSCNVPAGSVTVTPPGPSVTPGQTIELEAVGASSGNCSDGVLLYRFWVDGDANGQPGDPSDTLLRGWTTDPSILAAPSITTGYLIEFGCSSDPSCTATTTVTRLVACPVSAANAFPTVTAPNDATLVWSGPIDTVFVKGDLSGVSSLTPTQTGTLVGASSLDISGDAAGFWYLFREDVAAGPECNSAGTWSSGGSGELPGREGLP